VCLCAIMGKKSRQFSFDAVDHKNDGSSVLPFTLKEEEGV